MKLLIMNLLCVIACLPALAATLQGRVDELAAAPGVAVAEIVADDQAKPVVKPMPGFPQYGTVEVRYLYVSDGVVEDNVVALILTPDDQALWHRRVPAPLEQARRASAPPTVGTDEEIRNAINQAQSVTLADKLSIERGESSADVHGYVESNGKLLPVHYYVARDTKTGSWIVKPYDETATAKEALAR